MHFPLAPLPSGFLTLRQLSSNNGSCIHGIHEPGRWLSFLGLKTGKRAPVSTLSCLCQVIYKHPKFINLMGVTCLRRMEAILGELRNAMPDECPLMGADADTG
ncbi:hypothetical protein K474DRAFT_1670658 [Panus rudis PR-1116 ss-1]|nr:hypothetical protein K474DRAFT_1670658 [Panus rudis PR-1116 ss-1]